MVSRYKLTFGLNEKLQNTEGSKIVEAYRLRDPTKNNQIRITLVYKGYAAYTFDLSEGRNLTDKSTWEGKFDGKSFSGLLQFRSDNKLIDGDVKFVEEEYKSLAIKIVPEWP